jgi:acyl carrier protein
LFLALLQTDVAQLGALDLDARQWLVQARAVARLERFAALAAEARRDAGESAPTDGGLAASLRAAPPAEHGVVLERFVREQAAQVLRMRPERLDPQRPLQDLGIDSVMGLELRNRLRGALDAPLPATLVWTYPTVAQLAQHLLDLWRASHAVVAAEAASAGAATATATAAAGGGDELLAEFDAALGDIDELVKA